jgi:hypothetical protein
MHHVTRSLGSSRSSGRRFSSLLCAAVLVIIATACGGSSTSGQACSPGDTKPCTCPGGTSGLQTCDTADGGGYGACACTTDGGGDGAAGDGGPMGPAGFMQPCQFADGGMGNCDMGLMCFNFPNRGHFCTHSCSTAVDCASPSPGCNGMGVCKAP